MSYREQKARIHARAKAAAQEVKHDAATWCGITGWQIMDADGWDRRNFDESWAEQITEAEFIRRASMSTAMPPRPAPQAAERMSGAELMTHARFEAAHDVDPTAANKYRMGRADEVMPPGYVGWYADEIGGGAA